MWEIDVDGDFHYRCHVGHAYSAEAMNLALDDNSLRALLLLVLVANRPDIVCHCREVAV